MKPDF